MRTIYRPTGRALEYSFLALNPWGKSFCSHDCTYCYVPGTCRMSREQWRQQGFAPVKNLLKRLRADCAELRGTNERVLCCFMGDLYSPEAAETGVSRKILETFREFDIPFQVLTKGGKRAVDDFDLYGPHDAFATTLTTGGSEAWTWEPGAAGPADRIAAIATAKAMGISTWVSLEPVLDPDWSLRIIQMTNPHVDLYKIGKLNHERELEEMIDREYGWARFGREAVQLCDKYEVPYYIKGDLRKCMEAKDGPLDLQNVDTRKVNRS